MKKNVTNVYTYSWDVPDTVLYEEQPWKGAMHTSDLYFLFEGTNTIANAGNTFTAFNESEAVVSQEAVGYWTSFARTGDPSEAKITTAPAWPKFGTPSSYDWTPQRLLVQEGTSEMTRSGVEAVSDYELVRCAFWMSEEVTAETRV